MRCLFDDILKNNILASISCQAILTFWQSVVNGGLIPVTPESARIVLDVIGKSKKENGFYNC